MTKIQLDNLINFCFNFHSSMGISILDCDADYLTEKWHKYIGEIPSDNSFLHIKELEEDLSPLHKFGTIVGFDSKDVARTKTLIEWSKKWPNYNDVKEIINFILIISSKSIDDWTPTQIIEQFEYLIYKTDNINDEPYHNLHYNIRKHMNHWLESTYINRDYSLNILLEKDV